MIPGTDLWHLLGYPTPGAFRQAAHRGRVPVPLVVLPHRRGRFALRRDVASWIHQVSQAVSDSNAAAAGDAHHAATVEGTGPRHAESATHSNIGIRAFGVAIKALRERQRRSQKELALTAGMDQSFLAAIERGRRPPPQLRQVKRLIEALHATAEEAEQVMLAWELSRLARALGDRDPAFRDTLMQIAFWLASMPSGSRALLRVMAGGLPAGETKEGMPMV
ncbi:helix-turn-helix transcriptional regulator [Variovorax sp. CCNWLW225]|uniref:helix-turn-helix domain-containing protein n=1 Tax=Variovorax sp. CCNWLW225 TaxID=3127462 RepID=UPI0030777EC8